MAFLRLSQHSSLARRTITSRAPAATRNFHLTSSIAARKASEDKDSIDRSSVEYTQSATDDEVAQNKEASFDPKRTRPEEEEDTAGKGNKVVRDDQNPLEYSPANPEMSKTGDAAEGGQKTGGTKEKGSTRQSGQGHGPKGKTLRD